MLSDLSDGLQGALQEDVPGEVSMPSSGDPEESGKEPRGLLRGGRLGREAASQGPSPSPAAMRSRATFLKKRLID